ncbi:non-hydrolyzing UDP-N-acetylglucosamine 2-epimerase [uncultured Fibrella sp.]|uniref:non-hydrolyzing UDP-N-acetylglucosamine 2-epimerase n=1 Tax=uncultured Fibrella sp. TaxID=1284596 RepID=UPI0035C979C8
MKILNVVGARPNFMKVAPLHRAFLRHNDIESKIVHTGQHYDARMSDVFFNQIGLPKPDYYLGVTSGTHTQQTADIMTKFEAVMQTEQPDWVVVVGDVTSTLACALVAVRMGVQVAHVEAGLRSGDRQMPEEINRILTDNLSDLLFVTEQAGLDNLRREGIADEKVKFVGNVMIDSLVRYRDQAAALNMVQTLELTPGEYILLTMHRPSNVDTVDGLRALVQIASEAAQYDPVVFPLHPRTRSNLARFGLLDQLTTLKNVRLLEPQGYLEFLNLMEHAKAVVTDSGGIQEETTYLQIPCLTFRNSTERPSTVEFGTNTLLADLDPSTVSNHLNAIRSRKGKQGTIPPLWDGKAANRIVDVLLNSSLPEKIDLALP